MLYQICINIINKIIKNFVKKNFKNIVFIKLLKRKISNLIKNLLKNSRNFILKII